MSFNKMCERRPFKTETEVWTKIVTSVMMLMMMTTMTMTMMMMMIAIVVYNSRLTDVTTKLQTPGSPHLEPCSALKMMEQVIVVATAIVKLNEEQVSASNIPRANYTQSFLLGIIRGDPENCFCASFIKLSMLSQSWSCNQQSASKSLDFAESGSGSETSMEGGITNFSQEECLHFYEIDSLLTKINYVLEHINF